MPSSRIIQPYVCSTPLDFDVEREHLSTVVFPALADYADHLGGLFKPVDWHHRLASEHYASARVLLLALDSVRRSSPFFIGLLGETYGYHAPPRLLTTSDSSVTSVPSAIQPNEYRGLGSDNSDGPNGAADAAFCVQENLRLAAEAGYAWLDWTQQHSSVTELEILQGAFLGTSDPSDDDKLTPLDESASGEYRRFYFRLSGSLDVDLSEGAKNSRRAALVAESAYAEYKVRDLKARIAKKGLPVKYFSTPQELGSMVFDDWKQIIQKLCPLNVSRRLCNIDLQLARELISHELYIQNLRQAFVKTPHIASLLDKLNEFTRSLPSESMDVTQGGVNDKSLANHEENAYRSKYSTISEGSVFLLTGPRGSGKSAVLASWVTESANTERNVKVIYHFVGAGAQQQDVALFLRRCIVVLRAAYFPADEHACISDDEAANFGSLCDAFEAALALGRCLLILDGVDELGSSYGKSALEMRRLTWLPTRLPATCRIILSMAASDLSYRYARQRNDCIEHSLVPLTQLTERLDVLREHLARQRRDSREMALSDSIGERLVGHRMGESPLYLTVVASELRDIHVIKSLESHVTMYVGESSASSAEDRGVWGSVLRRWCRDYSWTRYNDSETSSHADTSEGGTGAHNFEVGGWITDALRLLACARGGLREEEILGALEHMGYVGTARVKPFNWNLFYNAARFLFLLHPDGTISIAHQHFVDVFEYILMGSILPLTMKLTRANTRMEHASDLSSQHGSLAYHEALASCLVALPWARQSKRLTEALWHLEKSSQWQILCDHITNPMVLLRLYDKDDTHVVRESVLRYYTLLCEQHLNPLERLKSALLYDGSAARLRQSPEAGGLQESLVPGRSGDVTGRTRETVSACSKASRSPKSLSPDLALEPVSHSKRLRRRISFSAPPGRMNERQNVRSRRALGLSTELVAAAQSTMSTRDRVRFGMCLARLLNDLGDRPSALEVLTETHYIAAKNGVAPIADGGLLLVGVEELIGDVLAAVSSDGQQTSQLAVGRSAVQWFKKAYCSLLDVGRGADQDDGLTDTIDFADGAGGWIHKGQLLLKLGIEELKTGALDTAESHLLEAKIHLKETLCRLGRMKAIYFIGKIRSQQGRPGEAKKLMEKALSYISHWYGRKCELLASIRHDLGCLSASLQEGLWDAAEATTHLRDALQIRRHISPNSLSLADTLYELGILTQKSATKTAKKEALELLTECLDIRIKQLGADNSKTISARRAAHDLEVALRLGQYQFGSNPFGARGTDPVRQPEQTSSTTGNHPHNSALSSLHDTEYQQPAVGACTPGVEQSTWQRGTPQTGSNRGSSASTGAPRLHQTAANRGVLGLHRSLTSAGRPHTAPSVIARAAHTVPELRCVTSSTGRESRTGDTFHGAAKNQAIEILQIPYGVRRPENVPWTVTDDALPSGARKAATELRPSTFDDQLIEGNKPGLEFYEQMAGIDETVSANDALQGWDNRAVSPSLKSGRVSHSSRGRHHTCLTNEDTSRCLVSTVTHGHASALSRLLDVEPGAQCYDRSKPTRPNAAPTGHLAAWHHRNGHYAPNPNDTLLVTKATNAWRRSKAQSAPLQSKRRPPASVPHSRTDELDDCMQDSETIESCLVIQSVLR